MPTPQIDFKKYWQLFGLNKKTDKWNAISCEWYNREITREEALQLFFGIQKKYANAKLMFFDNGKEKILWEDAELLKKEIPITSVQGKKWAWREYLEKRRKEMKK